MFGEGNSISSCNEGGKKIVLVGCVLLLSMSYELYAQKYEIGCAVGMSSYMGDANRTNLFLNPKPAGGILFGYNPNAHWSIKADMVVGGVSGNTVNSSNAFPFNGEMSFARTFFDSAIVSEFNLMPFGIKSSYLNIRPYTPYVFVGIGACFARGENTFFGMSLPFGIGFKYKINDRCNIESSLSVRKLFKDDFDVTAYDKDSLWNLDAPYGIKSSPLKNQDLYSLFLISVMWRVGDKKDPCD